MKEPKKIPLTDSPRSKSVQTISLESIEDKTIISSNISNENNTQNNSESLQTLESYETN